MTAQRAAPSALGAGAAKNGTRTLKLTKPIVAHGGTKHELVFQPLTAGIMMRRKELPFRIINGADGSRTAQTDFALLGEYIADLTGVEPTFLEQMAPADFAQAGFIVTDMINESGNS